MNNNLPGKIALFLSVTFVSQLSLSSDPIRLESKFDPNEISWVKKKGSASIEGEAYIKLEDGTYKGCSGFNIELLPVSDYSSERIYKTYGSNDSGQILISENPPKFTPDAKEYHDLVLKTKCSENNKFSFSNVHPGNYYVMAFIIWGENQGGGVMKRVTVDSTDEKTTVLRVE